MTAFADARRGDNKMKQMTLEEISKAAASGAFRKIPVSREIYSDIRTPVETLKVLQGVSSHCYMLESVEDKKQWGRYTFLGYDPSLELTCVNGNLTITADAATHTQTVAMTYLPADYTKVDEAIAKANVLKKEKPASTKLGTSDKGPQTGDTSNLALWIALLFVSGGAAIGTTVVSRKKKYNR